MSDIMGNGALGEQFRDALAEGLNRIFQRAGGIAVLQRSPVISFTGQQPVEHPGNIGIAAADPVHHLDIRVGRLLIVCILPGAIDNGAEGMTLGTVYHPRRALEYGNATSALKNTIPGDLLSTDLKEIDGIIPFFQSSVRFSALPFKRVKCRVFNSLSHNSVRFSAHSIQES